MKTYSDSGSKSNVWSWMFLCAVIVVLIVVTICVFRPARSAIQIGGDEGFEVSKGLLWARGYPLYEKIWSDQPPLYTVLLGVLFKYFGPTIGIARGLAAAFALLLLAIFFLSVQNNCGKNAACLATVCLLATQNGILLAVSVMQELPAITVALFAVWPIYKWSTIPHWACLILSGIILAIALQIKLTAVMMAPAVIVEIVLATLVTTKSSYVRNVAWNLGVWGGGIVGSFLILAKIFGIDYEQITSVHFSTAIRHSSESNSHAFSSRLLFEHTEALWGTMAGAVVLFFKRDWRRLSFPSILLITALVIHFYHRPWWDYYYLHFALPMAWLSGYGIVGLFFLARKWFAFELSLRSVIASWFYLAGGVLLLLLVLNSGLRIISEVNQIRSLPQVEDSPLITKMEEYAGRTRWVYTRYVIYPFHARLCVIPELAVVSYKRLWSAQIDDTGILKLVRQYKPEQVLLNTELDQNMMSFVKTNYTLVYEDGWRRLYVINRP